ncbi:MAG: helix-turn-helix domain-containing protein [Pseudomonadota bacterium]|nr:helix-turn-helix domain-containing protein [Pseudomonadota bacterium]
MHSAIATNFVHSYIDAWNHHDAKLVADHLTPDGIYHDIPTRQEHHKSSLIALLAEEFNHDDSHYQLEGEIQSGRHSIAFQYSVQSLEDNVPWYGAEFIDLKGQQAVHIRDFYQAPKLGSRARKYVKSGLNDETFERLKSRLTDLMTNDRTYLYPDLTLPKLAHLMHCSVNHLSQVINAGFGMSFFDFLNQHRIQAAKRLLIQSDNRRQSIITVAYAVGFNSNSAFYTAFKNSCGQTPAQFRREHAQDI